MLFLKAGTNFKNMTPIFLSGGMSVSSFYSVGYEYLSSFREGWLQIATGHGKGLCKLYKGSWV